MSDVRQIKWDWRFLLLSNHVAQWSKDPSTKIGAVIVRSMNEVVSMGYNGFAKGMNDIADLYDNRKEKYSRVVHGEVNALLLARQPVTGCTLYTTPFLPCERCTVQVIQAGIRRVVSHICIDPRWAESLAKARGYFEEADVEVMEY